MLISKACRSRLALAGSLWLAALLGAEPVFADSKPAPLATEQPAATQPWQRYGGWPKAVYGDFSTLATVKSPPAPKLDEIRTLSGPIEGDIEKGMKLAFDRSRGGSCLACHVMGPKSAELPGNVGPDLSNIGEAGRTDEWFFNYVYDPRVYNPETVMPPWGAHGIFTEAEIRDIVAFLKSLKQPASFKAELDDPERRPVPEEKRDNLDELINPAVWEVEEGESLFARQGPNGQACAGCHGDPAQAFKTWAAQMPRWEDRLQKVLGVEEFVARHALATTGESLPMQSKGNTALSIWLRNLANGTPIKVDVESPGAREAAARGEALMHRKLGQLNFACLDCHAPDRGANKWIRGQYLAENRGQVPHFPTWRTSRSEVWDIRKRFQWCNVAIRADELAPDAAEYGELELYLAHLNEGLQLNVPGIRH